MLFDYMFLHPGYFWFLLLLPISIGLSRILSLKPYLNFTYGDTVDLKFNYRSLFRRLFFISTLICLITALAAPYIEEEEVISREIGKSIAIVIDVSESMRSLDFVNNRLSFAKKVATELINETSKIDKISIIPFGAEAYIHSPLSEYKEVNSFMLQQLEIGKIEGSSSAVGNGASQGINALLSDSSNYKSVIIITDGSSLGLGVSASEVIKFANNNNTVIHSIALGDRGKVPFPVTDQYGNHSVSWMENDIDISILRDLSSKTKGEFVQIKNEKASYDLQPFIRALGEKKFSNNVVLKRKVFQKHFFILSFIFGCFLVVILMVLEKPLSY